MDVCRPSHAVPRGTPCPNVALTPLCLQEKVESFPFNVTSNPMYYGSTLSFLATALWLVTPPVAPPTFTPD